jgi:hypothetical protein
MLWVAVKFTDYYDLQSIDTKNADLPFTIRGCVGSIKSTLWLMLEAGMKQVLPAFSTIGYP